MSSAGSEKLRQREENCMCVFVCVHSTPANTRTQTATVKKAPGTRVIIVNNSDGLNTIAVNEGLSSESRREILKGLQVRRRRR